ncbi:MAG: hypothetical protein V2J10_04825 [Wenzhouxiangella sp.]|nr:hypothetical protein [Wenzhouxiangella sp.]
MQFTTRSEDPTAIKTDCLIVGVLNEDAFDDTVAALDAASG